MIVNDIIKYRNKYNKAAVRIFIGKYVCDKMNNIGTQTNSREETFMRKTMLVALAIMLVAAVAVSAADAPITKIGLGHVISIASSKDATATATAVGQVDTVMAAVAFDAAGKVVKISIDNAQTKVNFDKDMKVASDVNVEPKTKVEVKEGYGMAKVSTIKLEWYQQMANFEKWMIGKTVAEIKALKVKQRDASHTNVPDIPELTSLVTITVQDYIAAVEDAWNNAVAVKAGGVKFGLGQNVSIKSSKSATDTVAPVAQVDCVMAATLFDAAGKVVETIIDNGQTKVNFDKTGKVTSDKTAEYKTKKEVKEGYGMAKVSTIKLEWYQQMENFEAWMAGKTVAQIQALKVKTRDASHTNVPDVPELTSLVTITVQDYIAAVAESFVNAK